MLTQLAASLPILIRSFWILATFAALVGLIPLPFAQGFRNAVLLSACRGKLMEIKPPHALGPLSDWTVPQKWFAHFYAIGAIWNTVITFFFLSSPLYYSLDPTHEAVYLMVLVLLEFHLVRRFLETVGLMRYPEQARMHGIAYLFGVVYYLVLPLTILPDDAFESIAQFDVKMEGVHGAALGTAGKVGQDLLHLLSLRNKLGVGIFLLGSALQSHSHYLLARLAARSGIGSKSPRRRRSTSITTGTKKTTTPRYRIPRGGGFDYVSCPHYLGEIVIYLGLVVLTGGLVTGPWLVLVWVVANLVLAAGLTHHWYQEHFKTYPKRRRAIIPYIY